MNPFPLMAAVCALVSCFGCILCATPLAVLTDFFGRRWDPNDARAYGRSAKFQMCWGVVVSCLFCVCLVIRPRFRFQSADADPYRHLPWIVIPNHTHMVDDPLLSATLAQLGRLDLRWVVKKTLMDTFVIGTLLRLSGAAPVTRSRDPHDLAEIARCAAQVCVARACLILFVEGTRRTPENAQPGFENLLPAKTHGFDAACRAMTGPYAVVSPTILWQRPICSGLIRSLIDLFGQKLVVSVQIFPSAEVAPDPAAWLEKYWTQKDAEMSRARS